MSGTLSKLSFNFNETTLDTFVVKYDGDKENETYFMAKQVARMLGFKHTRHAVRRHCVSGITISDLSRGGRNVPLFSECLHPETMIIPESDVYRLVMRSKVPMAVEFQDFVCKKLLPTIRRHGRFPPPPPEQQRHVPAIEYDIGTHEDRMRHFETLDDDRRKDMRRETLTETNSLKSERHVNMGRNGGNRRVFNERKRYRDLKENYDHLLETFYRLQDDYERLLQGKF